MIKKLLSLLTILFITTSIASAQHNHKNIPQKLTFKERRQIESYLNEKLSLTEEQQDQLRKNRIIHRKKMNEIVEKMETLHFKIRDVYYSGIPKLQADLKTAPMKAELVLLKQNADKLRQENRKNFQKILTPEQKIKFEELKAGSPPQKPSLNQERTEFAHQ